MRQLARPHLRQVVRERAVRHELRDDVNGRRLGAHAEQAHDVRVCELVHNLRLLDELALVRVVRRILLLQRLDSNVIPATQSYTLQILSTDHTLVPKQCKECYCYQYESQQYHLR